MIFVTSNAERVFTAQSNEEAIFVTSNVKRVFTAESRIQIWFSHQYLIVMKLTEKSKTLVCSKHTHKMSLVFKTKKPINEIYLNFGPLNLPINKEGKKKKCNARINEWNKNL